MSRRKSVLLASMKGIIMNQSACASRTDAMHVDVRVNKMTEQLEIYKCNVCGNIVEVIHTGVGELVCCNQPMNKMDEQTADASTEKHVPVIDKSDNGFNVRVGSVPHPMEDKHYIEWIQLLADGRAYRIFLKPGQQPEALFEKIADNVSAREFCNVHGLWKG